MDKSPVDLFLELKDYDGKAVSGETADAEFKPKKAIEISEFKLDGDSAESRALGDDDEGESETSRAEKPDKKNDKLNPRRTREKSGPYCKFEITKVVDSASTSLLLAYCWTISSKDAVFGPKYASAKVTVRKSGGAQHKFLILTFEDVSVINYNLDVKSEYPEESMTFKFEKLSMLYFPQLSDGSLDVLRSAEWDFHEATGSESK
jgi:type VI protein secretion system component Hcp